ncbi:hypothetical protein [Halomarina litorea]|uniref:hypothetical protein n=1 Tax=Halomarina litorea TaxID=2961595 RepID=UPI0020C3CB55|nr:hypothetical protein [Halomarina sp. BCD28]
MTRAARAVRWAAVASVGALCLLVAGVGAVAMVAEYNATWDWYFLMERAVAFATPAAMWLLAAVLVGLVGLTVVARD